MMCATEVAVLLTDQLKEVAPTDDKLAGRRIKAYAGFLPRTRSVTDKQKLNPAISVRPVKVVDSLNEGSTVELQIILTVYNASEDFDNSHEELYHYLECMRQALLTNPIIASKYILKYPVETGIPEEQPYPEWWGYMKLIYSVQTPVKKWI